MAAVLRKYDVRTMARARCWQPCRFRDAAQAWSKVLEGDVAAAHNCRCTSLQLLQAMQAAVERRQNVRGPWRVLQVRDDGGERGHEGVQDVRFVRRLGATVLPLLHKSARLIDVFSPFCASCSTPLTQKQCNESGHVDLYKIMQAKRC